MTGQDRVRSVRSWRRVASVVFRVQMIGCASSSCSSSAAGERITLPVVMGEGRSLSDTQHHRLLIYNVARCVEC